MFYHIDLLIQKKKNFANIKDKVSSLAHKDLERERERERERVASSFSLCCYSIEIDVMPKR